jgi:uncharacterized protein DUF4070
VFPRYTRSFGTLHHACPMIPRVKAFMPPQGLLLIAATLPEGWEVRFVEQNMAGVKIPARILWRVGVLSDYRRIFWRMAWPALKRGDIESVVHTGLVGHHLIRFARDCQSGVGEYSFYAEKATAPVRFPAASRPAEATV